MYAIRSYYVSVPEISLPHIEGASKHTLEALFTLSTRFAYGISLASLLFFLGPIVILESQQTLKDLQNHLGKNKVYSAPLEPVFTQTPEPYASSPMDVFSIRVPDLEIESVIIPNVDTTDKDSYSPALKEGIAHAAGSGFPGESELV